MNNNIRPRNSNIDVPSPANVNVYNKGFSYRKKPASLKYNPAVVTIYDAQWSVRAPKVVVFDLDETIGHFSDLYLLWMGIFTQGIYTGSRDSHTIQQIFNELLDLYPEFLRYGILDILEFIRTKIQNGESHRIFLYTNNQCGFVACSDNPQFHQQSPTEWIKMITVYLNWKIRATDTIFANPICAFKINNRIIEPLRKNDNKTRTCFLKCAVLPKNTEICFIDDSYHSQMLHNKIYYIQPPPYRHNLTRMMVIDRFIQSPLHTKLIRFISPAYNCGFASFLQSTLPPMSAAKVHTPELNAETTKQRYVYDKMMYYIKEFFCVTSRVNHTRKQNARLNRFTRKRKHRIPR
jgi:hypothetical protein